MLETVSVLVLVRRRHRLFPVEATGFEAHEGLGGRVPPLRDEHDERQRLLRFLQQTLQPRGSNQQNGTTCVRVCAYEYVRTFSRLQLGSKPTYLKVVHHRFHEFFTKGRICFERPTERVEVEDGTARSFIK